MNIVVNGKPKSLTAPYKHLTYEQVCILAFGPPGESVYTITYFHRKGRGGTLVSGESVRLKPGMVFTCVQTNKG